MSGWRLRVASRQASPPSSASTVRTHSPVNLPAASEGVAALFAASRVNITGVTEGSIQVAFTILAPPDSDASADALSVSAAVAALNTTLTSCIDDAAVTCPTFAGYEPAALAVEETTPPPEETLDEDALLRKPPTAIVAAMAWSFWLRV